VGKIVACTARLPRWRGFSQFRLSRGPLVERHIRLEGIHQKDFSLSPARSRPRSKTMTKFFLLGLFGLLSAVMTAQAQVFDNLPITEAEKQWFDTGFVQSCCNLGDAFISDLYFEKDGHFYAEITDGFDHHPKVQRVIIPPGTIREIPPEIFNKMKTAPQNPTNHGIIFLYLSFDGLQGYHMTPQTGVLAVKPEEADVLCYWRGSGS
jgi:hypothetical protein